MRDSPPVSVLRRFVIPCGIAVATSSIAGCSRDEGGNAENFCADLRTRATELVNPTLSTQADVEAYLAMHDDLSQHVPLAIEEDWDVYVGMLRTAATVIPGDTASAEEARRAAYAAEQSAFRVYDWVNTNCGFDLTTAGPVARYDPAVTTTTVAGATTTATAATTVAGATTSVAAAPTTVAG